MQTKFVSLGLVVISIAAALAAWVVSAASPGEVDTIAGPGQTISVIELQRGIDVKSLPVQEIVNPI